MKDKLPKGWEWKKLSDLLLIERGGSPRPIEKYLTQSSDGINWIKISDATASDKYIFKTAEKITNEGLHKTKMVYEGDFILSNSMSFGKPYIMKTIGCIHDGWLLLREKKEVELDKEFLYYLLTSPVLFKQFNILAAGTTVRNLNISLVSSVQIPLPLLLEQKQIVSVLDKTFEKLDQAIALVEENIQKLKQLNESVLDEVFKNNIFPKIKIKYVVQKTGQFNPKNNPDTEYIYVDISAIDKDIQKITSPNRFIGKKAPSRAKKHIQKGDILFATTRPNLKNIALVENEYVNAVASTGFCVLRINDKIETNYLFHYLTSQIIQEEIAPHIRGAQYPAISDSDLLSCEIPLPSLTEQQLIVDYLDQTTEKNQKLTQYYQNKLEALKRLKNSVLDSAFKGGLRREKIVSISPPVIDPYFARSKKFNARKNADKQAMVIAFSIEAHEKLGKSLYRTKGEKTVEVIEKHLNLDFGREAEKMTAGPADFKHLVNVVEPLANEKKWFYTQEIKGENYDSHKYIKAENFNPFMMRCVQDLKQNLNEVRRIVNLFANIKTTRIAEVVATTYTAWNNLIIQNVQIDNETIVSEARENWHEAKLKIDRQEFFDAIGWLKNNSLIPQGNGKEVN